jgi:hypothetical protein
MVLSFVCQPVTRLASGSADRQNPSVTNLSIRLARDEG